MRPVPEGCHTASRISHLGSVRALASPAPRVSNQRRACLSSLSTTCASSLSFSFFSSASVFASGARKAICLPSGDQAKFFTLRFPLVKALASPPSARMALALRGLRYHERQPIAVGRKLQVGNTAQVQRGFGSQQLRPCGLGWFLSNNRRGEERQSKQGASGKRKIHQ